jgi:hypothetical protein
MSIIIAAHDPSVRFADTSPASLGRTYAATNRAGNFVRDASFLGAACVQPASSRC